MIKILRILFLLLIASLNFGFTAIAVDFGFDNPVMWFFIPLMVVNTLIPFNLIGRQLNEMEKR